MKKLILASQSPRRKEMLTALGLAFQCITPRKEEISHKKKPHAIVQDLARQKAEEVATPLTKGIILAADTIVVCHGEVIGKPRSAEDAKRILSLITTHTHAVYTGIAVFDLTRRKEYVGYEKTVVKMRHLSNREISLLAHKHMDKAGAYAIQEDGDALIEYIQGDYYNVVGLPLAKTVALLRTCGIHISEKKITALLNKPEPLRYQQHRETTH